MKLPEPEPGLVIRYAYLWRREFLAGQEEGVKDRPCAIVAAVRKEEDGTAVLVVPVTHTAPENPETAIEIPLPVKRYLGLDDEPSWIMLDESNTFFWPGPDLRRVKDGGADTAAYGFLPPHLFATMRKKFIALERARRSHRVRRTE